MYKETIKEKEMYAVIPARSGSKGIEDKNIRCLKGYPLIAYSIAAAERCPEISRIIVSTDSPKYAKIANYYGAETPFLRPSEISVDTSTDLEFMNHTIEWLYRNEQKLPEYFMHLRPTSPIRCAEVVEDAVKRIYGDNQATSLRSAHLSIHTPYKWLCLRSDGYFRSFIKEMSVDQANNPRQDFEAVYIPDGYVDILKTKFILDNKLLHGERAIGFIVPDTIDIDTIEDIERIEYYMEKNQDPLLDYLQKRYKTLDELDF